MNVFLVLRLIFKINVFNWVHVPTKLFRNVSAQILHWCINLCIFYPLVFLMLCPTLLTLPRQETFKKINRNISNTLHVVSSWLLNAQMCFYRCIPCSTSQTFSFFIYYVFAISICIHFCQSEVEQVELALWFSSAHTVVIGLNITMNQVPRVQVLDVWDHLLK